ncbi:MAG: TolC family protein [Thermoanaerobaculum sp.]|nr:TolC family protein [Thermoanaerobaculum sp.]
MEAASEVQSAKSKVEEAKKALEQLRLSWLPVLSIEAGLGSEGFRLGWALQFDLFSPDRGAQIKIAEAQVRLSELSLETARSSVRQQLSERCSALAAALQAWERLPLEQEQWALQEQINRTKYAAGLLSESEWLDFQRQKDAFVLESKQRVVDVFLAYLELQAALGESVNWEDWLK